LTNTFVAGSKHSLMMSIAIVKRRNRNHRVGYQQTAIGASRARTGPDFGEAVRHR
jgi:hypothetical protein